MAIILPSGFNITNIDPIDSRFTVATQAARLGFSAANVYNGLIVFQQDTNELYVLTNTGSYNSVTGWELVGRDIATGSFATTGSNRFNGDQIITGSLTVTNTITAQKLIVQQVTSSVLYSSGSNKFGNELSNTHQFTGSVFITGSNFLFNNNKVIDSSLTGSMSVLSSSFASTASLALQVSTSISTQNLQHNVLFVDTSGPGYIQVDGGLRYNPNQDLLTTTSSYANQAASASYVLNSISSSLASTASFALTASYLSGYVSPFPYTGSAIITGSLVVTGSTSITGDITGSNALFTGTITAQKLVVQTITSSIVYSSGSNIFGSQLTDIQSFTGSLRVTGSGNHYIVGGNVGIGTTSPNATLDVSGSVNISGSGTQIPFQITSGSTSLMFVSSSGNVSIGTTSSLERLRIQGNGTNSSIGVYDNTGVVKFRVGSGAGAPELFLSTIGNININSKFQTAAQNAIEISNQGLALSNTTNANQGVIGINGFTFAPAAGSGSFRPINVSYTINASGAQVGSVTGILVNAVETSLSGSTHNLMDLQISGSSRFLVNNTSTIITGSVFITGSSITIGSTTISPTATSTFGVGVGSDVYTTFGSQNKSITFRFKTGTTPSTLTSGVVIENALSSNIVTNQTGSFGILDLTSVGFSPTAGGANFYGINLSNTINSQGSGSIKSIYYNPTITRITGSHRFIESTAGDVLIQSGSYPILFVTGSGQVGIGTSSPSYSLDVSGSGRFTNGLTITGSLQVSASIFQYSNNASITTSSIGNIASFPTSSYQAGFFDYVASSGTNARAGTIFTVWNGSLIEFSETATNDIGLTNNLILSASLSGANILLQGRSLSGSWSVKTLTRMI
jgi:hypothetical protein